MKNYELITKLMELPAGLDIIVGGLRTEKELETELFDENDIDGKIYSCDGELMDIDDDNNNIYLKF